MADSPASEGARTDTEADEHDGEEEGEEMEGEGEDEGGEEAEVEEEEAEEEDEGEDKGEEEEEEEDPPFVDLYDARQAAESSSRSSRASAALAARGPEDGGGDPSRPAALELPTEVWALVINRAPSCRCAGGLTRLLPLTPLFSLSLRRAVPLTGAMLSGPTSRRWSHRALLMSDPYLICCLGMPPRSPALSGPRQTRFPGASGPVPCASAAAAPFSSRPWASST